MWTIDKEFSFCYGHRVWTQELDPSFCAVGDNSCKCRHPHGHQGTVHIFLEAEGLQQGMVTDFKHLGWLKDVIDQYIDHKFIIDRNDPLFEGTVVAPWKEAFGLDPYCIESPVLSRINPKIGTDIWINAATVNIPEHQEKFIKVPKALYEWLEGFLVVDFTPTSENLAKWMYDLVAGKMNGNYTLGNSIRVNRVEWNETPKSRSTYYGDKK